MFAKPVMIILPGILLLEEILLCSGTGDESKISAAARCSALLRGLRFKSGIKPESLRIYALLAVSAVSGIVVFLNLTGPFRAAGHRPLNEIAACYVYLTGEWIRRLFLLEPVQHFYRWPDSSVLFSALPGCLIIIGVSLTALWLALFDVKYDRRMIFGLFFAVFAFLPPLMHLRYSQDFITADRYGYFPLAGLFLALSVLLNSASGMKRRILLASVALWISVMAIKAVDTVSTWSSDILFWRHEVTTKPDSSVDNYFYGLALLNKDRYKESINAFDICIRYKSSYLQRALFSSGSACFYLGNYDKALKMYKKALEANGTSQYVSLIYSSMAEVYLKKKNVGMALGMMQKALANNPENAAAHLRISQIYLYLDNADAAIKHIRKAAELGGDIPEDLQHFLPEKD
jgi:tetratricopeptide (TPR) repeat protein